MSIRKRIIEDYFKKTRLPMYRRMLEMAKSKGYVMVGINDLHNLVVSGEIDKIDKLLINRHDIDTSPKVARKMFDIEKSVYGQEGTATYYFRNCTIDKKLIAEIDSYGYETGYHYEEIATFEKKYKMKNLDELISKFDLIGNLFLENLNTFRKRTSSKSITVASHGDFINTKYKFQNYELLKDESLRNKAGIIVEAYDEIVNSCVVERHADHVEHERFTDFVMNSIDNECKCIMILTHPRNWEVDFWDTSRENLTRLMQGIKYR